jgi:glucose/arabinose dehydrogenase
VNSTGLTRSFFSPLFVCSILAACGSGGGSSDVAEGVDAPAHDVSADAAPDLVADAAEFPDGAEPLDAAEPPDGAEPLDVAEPPEGAEPLDATEAGDAPHDLDAEADEIDPPPPATCTFPAAALLQNASLPVGFCAWIWASDLGTPRGITTAANGDVLVVERAGGQVTVLFDDDGDGVSGSSERAPLAEAPGLNHGVAIHGGFLYASSASAVYRWAYAAGARADLGAPQTVIQGIPSGGHSTRTLAFDDLGRLYVSVGSKSNLDSNSDRARIRRFSAAQVAAGGVAFDQGEIFADGLRNEVGLAFDPQGVLWGVENGIDNLERADLGGDLHNTNPSEEVNRFAVPGAFYGYPYCWSEYQLAEGVGGGPGTQWLHPAFDDDGVHSDAWCKDPGNVTPPAFAMPAHVAPLDVLFYRGAAFPQDARGDAFVSWHGSWNSDDPVGRKVVRLRFGANGQPQALEPLLEYMGPGDVAGDWPHRPVGLAVDALGRLLVTSDASGAVLAIGYDAEGGQQPPTLLGEGSGGAGRFGCAVSARW